MPPPDKSADGIGVFDVAQNKVERIIKGGSDPENFDISNDGKQLYISNEDDSAVSVVDIASGTVIKSAKMGGQPEGVKFTPDGRQVWVTSEETATIAVLDPESGKVAHTFKVVTVRARSRFSLMDQKPISMPKMTGLWYLSMRLSTK